jgi:hypothetical protein
VHLQDAETVHKAQLRAAIDERRPVADAVLDAADAGRSTTRSVPRVGGLVRLARVQPLGCAAGRGVRPVGRAITEKVAALEREQARGVPVR